MRSRNARRSAVRPPPCGYLILPAYRYNRHLSASRHHADKLSRTLWRGPKRGRNPVGRGGAGSKHHLVADGSGIPLVCALTGGNRSDVAQLVPLQEAVPPVRGERGRPLRRLDTVLADCGYDHDKHRCLCASWASNRDCPSWHSTRLRPGPSEVKG
ncbi:transposase [Streptomyces barkulensis]